MPEVGFPPSFGYTSPMNTTAKMDFLVALYIFCICVSELMGGKTFPLFSLGTFQLNASVAIFTLPLVFSVNDIVTEVYGRERTRGIIRSGLFVVALILFFTMLATNLPPSVRFQGTEAAYDSVFGMSARFAAASLTAFAAAELIDVFIFVKIRKRLGKKALWLRNNVSNIIAQFFDTALFMTLAFYNLARPLDQNIPFLTSLILPYWGIKCAMSVIETPLVYAGVSWLKSEKKT